MQQQASRPLHLFEGYGIELEYMLVESDTLKVFPAADRVIYSVAGKYAGELERGAVSWSNELALHVLELKMTTPSVSLDRFSGLFHGQVREINRILGKDRARLMPGAMHPFMDPVAEMKLWPHDFNEIYTAFDRIFSCKGHGWVNLQSMHINLPFGNDEEFGRLHAAVRVALPLVPALAASSPVVDGKSGGSLDTRMKFYRTNSLKIPSITGDIIPEPVFSETEYRDRILNRIYRDLAPYDPDKVLQEEWVNARGAIARFTRNAVEIRIVDVQECPEADLAVASAIVCLIRAFVEERIASYEDQKRARTEPLKKILLDCIKYGENASIDNKDYLRLMGFDGERCKAGDLWDFCIKKAASLYPSFVSPFIPVLNGIIEKGTLATRILNSTGIPPDANGIMTTYRRLCDSLEENKPFSLSMQT